MLKEATTAHTRTTAHLLTLILLFLSLQTLIGMLNCGALSRMNILVLLKIK